MSLWRGLQAAVLAAALPLLCAAVPLAGERPGDAVLDAARCAAIAKPITLSLPFFVQAGQAMGDKARAALKSADDPFRTPVAAHDAGELLLDETRPKVTLAETKRACTLFQQAARGGVLDAYVPLGQLIRDTADTAANRDLARLAWQRAAAKDQPFAQLWLAVLDARTPGADAAARKAAATELARLAGIGFAPASLWLGNAAYEGWSGPPNAVEARGLYEVAARAGLPQAADALGNLLRSGGPGLDPDLPQSEHWFAVAFQMGWSRAAMDAGVSAGSPRNPQRDEARARAWFEKGMAAGDIGAKARLASFLAFAADPAKRDPKRAYALASAAAAGDSPTGNHVVASLLRSGTGVAADTVLALKFERRAVELGSPDAMVAMGRAQVLGQGMPRDPKAGLALIEQAARQNFTEGICWRGIAEMTIESSPAAALRAEPWLIEGARRDWPACLNMLGSIVVRGWYKEFSDPLLGVNLMARAALAGDRDAQFALGEMYAHPTIVDRDLPRAIKYYEAAAAQGHLMALVRLGGWQIAGINGFTADLAAGRARLERAMALGSCDAAANLAELAQRGAGEPADPAKAQRLYRKSAALGCPKAWGWLGQMVAAGSGSPADPAAAVALWQRGFDAGDLSQAQLLSRAYLDGTGVRADPARAVAVLKQAAAAGDAGSINNLGALYQHGQAGIPADPAAAEGWYRKAAADNVVALINLGYLVSNDAGHHDYAMALGYIDAGLHRGLDTMPAQSVDEIKARLGELRRVLDPAGLARGYALSADIVAGKLPPPFFAGGR